SHLRLGHTVIGGAFFPYVYASRLVTFESRVRLLEVAGLEVKDFRLFTVEFLLVGKLPLERPDFLGLLAECLDRKDGGDYSAEEKTEGCGGGDPGGSKHD